MPGRGNDFAREAVEELLKWMEDYPRDIAFILAGYKEELGNFIKHANPGLESRIPFRVDFPDYTDDELVEICAVMATSNDMGLANGCRDIIIQRMAQRRREQQGQFGNARDVRLLLQSAMLEQNDRVYSLSDSPTRDDLHLLVPADFEKAVIN